MKWIVLTAYSDGTPVLIDADDINLIHYSEKQPDATEIWFKNQEDGFEKVKESIAEIYIQMNTPHNTADIVDQLHRYEEEPKESIMNFYLTEKPKISRWLKWAKHVDPSMYRTILCKSLSCGDCPAYCETSCLTEIDFKAYMLEEVEDE